MQITLSVTNAHIDLHLHNLHFIWNKFYSVAITIEYGTWYRKKRSVYFHMLSVYRAKNLWNRYRTVQENMNTYNWWLIFHFLFKQNKYR
jgi:hypothetical protein